MILTITERLALNSILPERGDFLTLKDLRRLKEDLAISDEDRKAGVNFYSEYGCPKCKVKMVLPVPVKCAECDTWMLPTGQIGCDNWELEKDVAINETLTKLIEATLKVANDEKTLQERHITIYEKFIGEEEVK